MSRLKEKKRHFSLIELMVCVAILSIAASISIPRYMQHIFSQRHEECQQQLRALHAAEQMFYRDNGRYTADLKALGWTPPAKPYYLYGFRNGATGVVRTSLNPVVLCPSTSPDCFVTDLMVHADQNPLKISDLPESAVANTAGFVAACVGNIDSDAELDRISIDQSGQISQVTSDLD